MEHARSIARELEGRAVYRVTSTDSRPVGLPAAGPLGRSPFAPAIAVWECSDYAWSPGRTSTALLLPPQTPRISYCRKEDEEAIIDVVSIKTGKKQLSFAKQIARFDLESQRKEKHEDSDEDEPPVSRRPRGRPPGSSKRRTNRSGPAPKRARIQHNVHASQQPESFTSYQCQNSVRQCALRDSFEDTERRRLHNNMERQRRINMKESYEQLRKQVPAVAENDRASKVSILKQGAACIKFLTETGNSLKTNIKQLKEHNQVLKRKLQHLQHKQIFYNK
ncbi:Transcriptional regulator Myc [Acromyrmex echinatior]|uniref:Transcriptional regulator Myc n=1 Tax=Acromyrmex echinatior TaxID=103372 RepID=F4X505_ACREC|nr:Transcriptional regulator Myc [Acromyrmex echinatior]